MSKTTKRLSLQQSSTDSIQNDIELIGHCLGIIALADEVEAVEGGITRLLVNFLGILNLTTVNGEPDSGLLKVANEGY
jgi:glutamine amidotransferase PdxT